MAANAEAHSSIYIDSSSDDECLSVVKRKAETEDVDKKLKPEDSDEESIMAGVLVTVEVEEMDDDCPLEFTKNAKLKKRQKKKQQQLKTKKGRTFPCNDCDAEFDTAGALKTHSLEHQVKTSFYFRKKGNAYNAYNAAV
ncbi:unnamed protein product [Arctia plantaginis]|uniref:C2H2-type domain-containing protein n=1 Tax=Arctia plantaginis TaxID=874455 RepID=A0A8S0ZYG6_ARCPL|nr:unnamed protein product [Arctia plantaginis]